MSMNWQVLKMQEMEIKIETVLADVALNTGYEDGDILRYYFRKLVTKVKDYCRREELNVPLYDFIEKKLIEIALFKKAEEEAKASTGSTAAINGIGIENIKSISRGDTSITLRDGGKVESNKSSMGPNTLLEFSKDDYITLNRHRKVYR